MDVAFDMETSDPDDVFTLAFLSTHPAVTLRAVTVTPGSHAQIGVVRHVLAACGASDIPIGARKPDHAKPCVSEFHYTWLGDVPPADADDLGANVLARTIDAFPELVLVTGASLGNVAAALELTTKPLRDIVIQGGFAGDSVVPPEHRLPKFEGKETCPTFNLNGDVPAAKAVLASEKITRRRLVSKNVCHGVVYDAPMHDRMSAVAHPTRGFAFMREGMARYLAATPTGKAFHDPLAACTAIEPSICTFREVEVYRAKGEWGSRLADATRTFISIAHDRVAFERVLAAS